MRDFAFLGEIAFFTFYIQISMTLLKKVVMMVTVPHFFCLYRTRSDSKLTAVQLELEYKEKWLKLTGPVTFIYIYK